MKKQDWVFIVAIILFFLPFFIFHFIFDIYEGFNKEHGMVMSFVKFAILATLGEVIGLRLKTGAYYRKGFGILPRAIVWGFLGLTIKMAFIIFAKGVPDFLVYMGLEDANEAITGDLSITKVAVAFCISVAMNVIYAPVMMTIHKITDTHIVSNGGTISGFLKPIKLGYIFENLDWNTQWHFVFKKTIPFFWIPAHTVTFLLSPDYQVLFAALLGIALGILLAVATLIKKE